MHRIGFRIDHHVDDPDRRPERVWLLVGITIDGRDLREYVREVEQPFATAEGHPDLAGQYLGHAADLSLPPVRRFLGAPPDDYEDDGRVAVLICTCGDEGCWSLRTRIEVGPGTVRWSDFANPHRTPAASGIGTERGPGWRYDALGPFTFDRRQYEAALEAAAHEYAALTSPSP